MRLLKWLWYTAQRAPHVLRLTRGLVMHHVTTKEWKDEAFAVWHVCRWRWYT